MEKDTISLQVVLQKRLTKRSKKLLGKIGKNFKAHSVPLKDYFQQTERGVLEQECDSSEAKRDMESIFTFLWQNNYKLIFKHICLRHIPTKHVQSDPVSNCKYSTKVFSSES